MLDPCNKTAGLTQEIQKLITKASGGDISRMDELVERAEKGAFDTRICLGIEGKLMCEYISKEPTASVVDQLEQ